MLSHLRTVNVFWSQTIAQMLQHFPQRSSDLWTPGLLLHNSFPALSLITMVQINKPVPLSTLLQIPHHYRRSHRWELFTWRGAEWDSVGASRPPELCMLLLLQRGFLRPVDAWSCSTLTGIASDCVLSSGGDHRLVLLFSFLWAVHSPSVGSAGQQVLNCQPDLWSWQFLHFIHCIDTNSVIFDHVQSTKHRTATKFCL